ncbi:MAG TPA: hypothetical protein PKW90_11420 [Myxococcota bacterium]|nr:hypothetical protein [Myxococcota bacterium]
MGAPLVTAEQEHRAGTRAGLGLTIHAGEEFRSLIEGMRAVDEAVLFSGMEAGDRLGHALSLGLDPRAWADTHADVVLQPRLARLDDLVWILPRLSRLGLGALADRAEAEMEKHASILYGKRCTRTQLPTQRQLYRAWELRKYLPEEEELPAETPLMQLIRRMQAEGLRHFGDARDLWKIYLEDEDFFAEGEKVIEVNVGGEWPDALRKVQDDALRDLARRGIAIEANPSSNVAIAPISRYQSRPIFRWFPPDATFNGQGPAVVVGSDDPAIFGAELYHDYAALACAAEQLGYPKTQIHDWLWRLREVGLRHLFGAEPGVQD